MDDYSVRHLHDLLSRSQRQNIFTFSGFLTPEEQSVLLTDRMFTGKVALYGGAEGAERRIARFGSESDLGYSEDFPVICLQISPLNDKFASPLSHRDYLGALMNLGIERSCIGDIIVREHTAYVFCIERIAPYITENLVRIGRNDIRAEVCDALPEGSFYKTETLRLTVTSLRIDCLASAACKLSRTKTAELMREKKLLINSAVCEKPERLLKEQDRFSVRGIGKFRFKETLGESKKGKIIIILEKYV